MEASIKREMEALGNSLNLSIYLSIYYLSIYIKPPGYLTCSCGLQLSKLHVYHRTPSKVVQAARLQKAWNSLMA